VAALALLAEAFAGRDQRKLHHLDLACGTGSFTAQIARAWPRLRVTGLDLSPPYVARAARTLAPWSRARAVVGLAEALPLADASVDCISCVYLFHELPPKVRVAVASEMGRVLKTGGVLVLADSLQRSDDPNLDRLLEAFPVGFHEPYYDSWLDLDLEGLFAPHGLKLRDGQRAFLTKGVAFAKAD
jgi:ubiquinone/menaquinone biosynthesis C-methylase UbiE